MILADYGLGARMVPVAVRSAPSPSPKMSDRVVVPTLPPACPRGSVWNPQRGECVSDNYFPGATQAQSRDVELPAPVEFTIPMRRAQRQRPASRDMDARRRDVWRRRGANINGFGQAAPFDAEQLRIGTAIEMEHTSDPATARKIAEDHLREDPKYYTKLVAMESGRVDLSKKLVGNITVKHAMIAGGGLLAFTLALAILK